MAKDFASNFRIEPGKRAHLGRRNPADLSLFPNRAAAEEQSATDGAAINELQDRLYAEGKRALLVLLQGVDTAGKDGTIRHVFNQTGPVGVTVTAFRRPTEVELSRDFLWRAHLACPRHGYIGIFNRSHYEDVLVGRVRKLAPKNEIEARYGQINAFEKILAETGTTILKFMLHISKKEQRERLQARLDEPKSRWKFNPADLDDAQALASIHGRLRAGARQVLDRLGALARHSVRPQVGAQRRDRSDRARDAGGDEPAVSQAEVGSRRASSSTEPAQLSPSLRALRGR